MVGETANLRPDMLKVLQYLRDKVPVKNKFIMGKQRNVQCFRGKNMIETLLASKYAQPGASPFIMDEVAALEFCQILLNHGSFHRAKYVDVAFAKGKKEITKKKIAPDEDNFVFSNDETYFIWTYTNPTSTLTWVLGGLLLLGIFAVMMMPLWPSSMRSVVEYASTGGMWLVAIFIALELLRAVLFLVVYMATFGKCNFWILPKLNDDKAGVWESLTTGLSIKWKGEDDKKKKARKSKAKTASDSTAAIEGTTEGAALEDITEGTTESAADAASEGAQASEDGLGDKKNN
eukprot:m.232345 g.232345  ORF g.232345 m.232345 type:complete len:290 (-) comp12342_c0_seq1:65-934(-)